MRILLVEDEHRIAAAVKKGLTQEHYAVDVSYDGNEGYDMASGEEYDLIILDLMLPGMDGVTLCKKLRSARNQTPVLMLTARGTTGDKVTGLDAGADDYLTKPFSFEELLARVRALSRRPKQVLGTILSVDGLSLDTKTLRVSRYGRDIFLTGKEYALLEYLMRHAGAIQTKDQIINHVWNYDADILPNTVEVTIRNLRKKIDLPFTGKPPLVKTVRGFGYSVGL